MVVEEEEEKKSSTHSQQMETHNMKKEKSKEKRKETLAHISSLKPPKKRWYVYLLCFGHVSNMGFFQQFIS